MKSFEEIYEDPQAKKALIGYFLKSVLGELITLVLVMTVAYLFQNKDNVFKILLLFIIPRVFIGGYHADSRLKCIIISIFIFNLGGLICKYVFNSSLMGHLLMTVVLLLGVILFEEGKSKEVE